MLASLFLTQKQSIIKKIKEYDSEFKFMRRFKNSDAE